jgi:hypothetical protein
MSYSHLTDVVISKNIWEWNFFACCIVKEQTRSQKIYILETWEKYGSNTTIK